MKPVDKILVFYMRGQNGNFSRKIPALPSSGISDFEMRPISLENKLFPFFR